jgi:hypothetical protein
MAAKMKKVEGMMVRPWTWSWSWTHTWTYPPVWTIRVWTYPRVLTIGPIAPAEEEIVKFDKDWASKLSSSLIEAGATPEMQQHFLKMQKAQMTQLKAKTIEFTRELTNGIDQISKQLAKVGKAPRRKARKKRKRR